LPQLPRPKLSLAENLYKNAAEEVTANLKNRFLSYLKKKKKPRLF